MASPEPPGFGCTACYHAATFNSVSTSFGGVNAFNLDIASDTRKADIIRHTRCWTRQKNCKRGQHPDGRLGDFSALAYRHSDITTPTDLYPSDTPRHPTIASRPGGALISCNFQKVNTSEGLITRLNLSDRRSCLRSSGEALISRLGVGDVLSSGGESQRLTARFGSPR